MNTSPPPTAALFSLASALPAPVLADVQPITLITVIVVGLVGVTMNPALVIRVAEAGGAGTMVSTIHTAVISAGVTIGSAVSGATMSTIGGDDPAIAMWTGAVLAVFAALMLATQTRTRRTLSAHATRTDS